MLTEQVINPRKVKTENLKLGMRGWQSTIFF